MRTIDILSRKDIEEIVHKRIEIELNRLNKKLTEIELKMNDLDIILRNLE